MAENAPAERIYHGVAVNDPDSTDGIATRITVVSGGGGPTERERARVLYELTPEEPFWWGYGGGSPARTAAAILRDVLPDVRTSAAAQPPDLDTMPSQLRHDLSVAFIQDFLAHFHDQHEFWLPARTVARWALGFLRAADRD